MCDNPLEMKCKKNESSLLGINYYFLYEISYNTFYLLLKYLFW